MTELIGNCFLDAARFRAKAGISTRASGRKLSAARLFTVPLIGAPSSARIVSPDRIVPRRKRKRNGCWSNPIATRWKGGGVSGSEAGLEFYEVGNHRVSKDRT